MLQPQFPDLMKINIVDFQGERGLYGAMMLLSAKPTKCTGT